jgi:methanogenic corrinoid protein MtbC1
MSILSDISTFLQQGRAPRVKELVTQALADGVPAKEILDEGLLAGMSVVGEKFKNNQMFVPEVLIAARAMNAGVDILKPYLQTDDMQGKGTVVIGTVKGDLHDIGKNLVRLMMEGKGLTVIDLGVDVSAEKFCNAAKEHNANIIACSALLTTTMNEMKNVVLRVREDPELSQKVKVMIGGAPVTQHSLRHHRSRPLHRRRGDAAQVALELCKQ